MANPGSRAVLCSAFTRHTARVQSNPVERVIDEGRPLTGRVDLFVYGTLKRDGIRHREFFSACVRSRSARAPGRIYDLPAGYPAVAIPERLELAVGSGEPAADALAAGKWREPIAKGIDGASFDEWVHGELLTLSDPSVLRQLDTLEGFHPGAPSLFLRVLAPVWPVGHSLPIPAWIYVQNKPRGRHLPSGRWPA